MSRRKRTKKARSGTLYVLPTIDDDMPDELKDAIAIRNVCATEGRCPACGVTPELWVDEHGLGHATFKHEDDCRAI